MGDGGIREGIGEEPNALATSFQELNFPPSG